MRFFLFLILLSAVNCRVCAQTDSLCLMNLRQHVLYLASDSLEGRATGSEGEKLANRYVLNQFVAVKRKSKFLTWTFDIQKDSLHLQSEMVGAFINNKAKQTLLIGAHIDHIGYGGELSKSIGKHEIHNGADDNASGVALLIELEKYLVKQKLPFNVLLVAFSGHEIGTYGSSYLAQHWDKKFGNIFCMLNMDMMGRMDMNSKKLLVSCSDTLASAFPSNAIQVQQTDHSRLALLDTKHFVSETIPCATFTTGMHNDYHKTSDDAVYLNFDGMLLELNYLENWILVFAKSFLPAR